MHENESRIRILIVDDHEIFRAGLATILASEDDFEVVGQASNGRQALAEATAREPGVILMDVRLSGERDTEGIEACRDILSVLPDTRVLMLSSYDEQDVVYSAVLSGAAGYLIKRVSRANLCEAIRSVAGGATLLDPAVTQKVLSLLLEGHGTEKKSPLSEREIEVLRYVARGYTNRQIAEALVISEYTARNHVIHILEKLGLSRRAEAAAWAEREGYLSEVNRQVE
jgi:two-component system, NarL family, response regulator DevR